MAAIKSPQSDFEIAISLSDEFEMLSNSMEAISATKIIQWAKKYPRSAAGLTAIVKRLNNSISKISKI